MIKIGQIKIIDSGFVKPNNAGTQASSDNMSNSGNEITIKTGQFTPSLSRSFDDSSDISSNNPSEVNKGSLSNMKISLSCILRTDTDSDMDIMSYLIDLICTDGYKLLWYDYTNATTEDNNGQLIYRIAQNDKFGHQFTSDEVTFWSLSTQFYHLHVDFFDIQARQTGKEGLVRYTLLGTVLPVPETTNDPGA